MEAVRTTRTLDRWDKSQELITWQHSYKPTPQSRIWPPSALCNLQSVSEVIHKCNVTVCIILTFTFCSDVSFEKLLETFWIREWMCKMVTNDCHFDWGVCYENSSFVLQSLGLDPRYLELSFINQVTNPLALLTFYKQNSKYVDTTCRIYVCMLANYILVILNDL